MQTLKVGMRVKIIQDVPDVVVFAGTSFIGKVGTIKEVDPKNLWVVIALEGGGLYLVHLCV